MFNEILCGLHPSPFPATPSLLHSFHFDTKLRWLPRTLFLMPTDQRQHRIACMSPPGNLPKLISTTTNKPFDGYRLVFQYKTSTIAKQYQLLNSLDIHCNAKIKRCHHPLHITHTKSPWFPPKLVIYKTSLKFFIGPKNVVKTWQSGKMLFDFYNCLSIFFCMWLVDTPTFYFHKKIP